MFFRICRVARLDAEVDHVAAGLLHLLEQRLRHEVDARVAAPLDLQAGGDERVAELGRPFLVGRERAVLEDEVRDAVLLDVECRMSSMMRSIDQKRSFLPIVIGASQNVHLNGHPRDSIIDSTYRPAIVGMLYLWMSTRS